MSKSQNPSTGGTDTAVESEPGPAARDEDPFDDDDVSSILDAAWADLHD